MTPGQRRQDREDRALWREVSARIAETNEAVRRFAEESRDADKRLEEKIDRLADESREADKRLGKRIDALVSANSSRGRRNSR